MPAEAEQNADSGDAEITARYENADHAERDSGITRPFGHGPAAGDRLGTRIGDLPGIRSEPSSEPVLAEGGPGPASSALRRLSGDVDDEDVVERFVGDYLHLLAARVETVRRLVSGSDTEATKVAILSLETSSAMIGGVDVSLAARTLRRAVHQGDRVGQHLEQLESAVDRFRLWLDAQGFSARR